MREMRLSKSHKDKIFDDIKDLMIETINSMIMKNLRFLGSVEDTVNGRFIPLSLIQLKHCHDEFDEYRAFIVYSHNGDVDGDERYEIVCYINHFHKADYFDVRPYHRFNRLP